MFIEESLFRKQIHLTYEDHLLGTVGTLVRNLIFFESEDGLLIYSDNYCTEDFTVFEHAHINHPLGCLMTMMTFHTDDPLSFGLVKVDESGVAFLTELSSDAPEVLLQRCRRLIMNKY